MGTLAGIGGPGLTGSYKLDIDIDPGDGEIDGRRDECGESIAGERL